jgi:hypothetical protein
MDETAYNAILNCAEGILRNNAQRLGAQFCNEFMTQYNPRSGQQGYNNAQFLFNYVSTEARRLNGNNVVQPDLLFQIVGAFVENIFNNYVAQVRQQQQGGGFNNGGGFSGGGFGSSSGFSGGGFNRNNSGFNNQQPGSRGPGSHLVDDTTTMTRTAPAPTVSPSTPMDKPIKVDVETSVVYKPNPLDELQDSSATFAEVRAKPIWGDEAAKDNRIVVAQRQELKCSNFVINRVGAFHQLILDDPLDVVKDFFTIVPDQTLGSPFVFRILYNHLDVIDLPTQAFVSIRNSCIEVVNEAERTKSPIVLHKQISKILESLPTGQWKAITSYLVEHINRALYLNARLTTGTNWTIKNKIKINTFDDVNELLSSSFSHPLTTHPDGRRALEALVAGVLWNVLVVNTSVMFDSGSIPTHAMQSSPVFPFSMEGVYPNKFSIPQDNDPEAKQFLKALEERELSQRTYLLSRRSVVITNTMGKTILPYIAKDATIISNPLATVFNACALPYGKISPDSEDTKYPIEPFVLDDYPSQQLENFYSDPANYGVEEQGRLSRTAPTKFPVDQTIFAVQFGTDPKDYLMALDIFTTIDNNLGSAQMVVAKKTLPTFRLV